LKKMSEPDRTWLRFTKTGFGWSGRGSGGNARSTKKKEVLEERGKLTKIKKNQSKRSHIGKAKKMPSKSVRKEGSKAAKGDGDSKHSKKSKTKTSPFGRVHDTPPRTIYR